MERTQEKIPGRRLSTVTGGGALGGLEPIHGLFLRYALSLLSEFLAQGSGGHWDPAPEVILSWWFSVPAPEKNATSRRGDLWPVPPRMKGQRPWQEVGQSQLVTLQGFQPLCVSRQDRGVAFFLETEHVASSHKQVTQRKPQP